MRLLRATSSHRSSAVRPGLETRSTWCWRLRALDLLIADPEITSDGVDLVDWLDRVSTVDSWCITCSFLCCLPSGHRLRVRSFDPTRQREATLSLTPDPMEGLKPRYRVPLGRPRARNAPVHHARQRDLWMGQRVVTESPAFCYCLSNALLRPRRHSCAGPCGHRGALITDERCDLPALVHGRAIAALEVTLR